MTLLLSLLARHQECSPTSGPRARAIRQILLWKIYYYRRSIYCAKIDLGGQATSKHCCTRIAWIEFRVYESISRRFGLQAVERVPRGEMPYKRPPRRRIIAQRMLPPLPSWRQNLWATSMRESTSSRSPKRKRACSLASISDHDRQVRLAISEIFCPPDEVLR